MDLDNGTWAAKFLTMATLGRTRNGGILVTPFSAMDSESPAPVDVCFKDREKKN